MTTTRAEWRHQRDCGVTSGSVQPVVVARHHLPSQTAVDTLDRDPWMCLFPAISRDNADGMNVRIFQ